MAPMDLRSSSNRNSFQTFVSSDTATQYPRREVRSEWVAENKLEMAALEEHQEALNLTDDFLAKGTSSVFERKKYTKAAMIILVAFFAVIAIGAGVAVGLGGNGGDKKFNVNEEIPLIEVGEFVDICNKFNELSDAPEEMLFGACFPDGRAAICNPRRAFIDTEGGVCFVLGAETGSDCQCPEGLLIELVVGSQADLCTVGFDCPPADLSILTQTPTASPTPEL